MNQKLLLAILSMYSYNRGYNPAIKISYLSSGQIGEASVFLQSTTDVNSDEYRGGLSASAHKITSSYGGFNEGQIALASRESNDTYADLVAVYCVGMPAHRPAGARTPPRASTSST